jgi:hypothetical protein
MKQWREHLRVVVARSFAPEARIVEVEREGDLALLISWRLGTDPKRPSKRSKTIRVAIEAEALDDYAAASPGQRQLADARLARHLQDQLLRFDPEHHTPLGQEPPLVRWSIGTVPLLG